VGSKLPLSPSGLLACRDIIGPTACKQQYRNKETISTFLNARSVPNDRATFCQSTKQISATQLLEYALATC